MNPIQNNWQKLNKLVTTNQEEVFGIVRDMLANRDKMWQNKIKDALDEIVR